jgi:hypothetical protein
MTDADRHACALVAWRRLSLPSRSHGDQQTVAQFTQHSSPIISRRRGQQATARQVDTHDKIPSNLPGRPAAVRLLQTNGVGARFAYRSRLVRSRQVDMLPPTCGYAHRAGGGPMGHRPNISVADEPWAYSVYN